MLSLLLRKSNKFSGGALDKWSKVALGDGLQMIEDEIANLKKSVSDGKTAVADAITDKGITTATDASFATMADNISQISTLATETADATATAAQILTGAKAYVKGSRVVGTMPNNGGPSAAIVDGSLKAGYTSGGAIAGLVASNIKQGVNICGIAGDLYDPKVIVRGLSTSVSENTNTTTNTRKDLKLDFGLSFEISPTDYTWRKKPGENFTISEPGFYAVLCESWENIASATNSFVISSDIIRINDPYNSGPQWFSENSKFYGVLVVLAINSGGYVGVDKWLNEGCFIKKITQ